MNNPPPPSTTSNSIAAYYAVMATTEAAMQSCAEYTTEPVETQLEKALIEIATLRLEVAALKGTMRQ